MQEGVEGKNRRLECFLSALSLLSFSHFFFFLDFSRKIVVIALRRQLFPFSSLQMLSLLSPLPPKRTSSKFGMMSSCFVCTPCSKPVFSSHVLREAEGHIAFPQTPQRLKCQGRQRQRWEDRRWLQGKKRFLRKAFGWKWCCRILFKDFIENQSYSP